MSLFAKFHNPRTATPEIAPTIALRLCSLATKASDTDWNRRPNFASSPYFRQFRREGMRRPMLSAATSPVSTTALTTVPHAMPQTPAPSATAVTENA